MSKQRTNLLLDLPLELLLLILENVSPVDIICLSLCNHSLLSLFPPKKVSKGYAREPPDGQQADLLTRLSHDSPGFFLCFCCLKLHLSRTVCLPGHSSAAQACWWRQVQSDNQPYLLLPMRFPGRSRYEINFEHVQLAMRRIRYGPQFGIPTEAFHYKEVRIEPIPDPAQFEEVRDFPTRPEEEKVLQGSHLKILFSVDARVCLGPPSLYLRNQVLLLAKNDNMASFITYLHHETAFLRVCWHINYWNGLLVILKDLGQAYSDDVATIARKQALCDTCTISWLTEIRSINEDEFCFNLTLWRDLGPGLRPNDHHSWYEQMFDRCGYKEAEEHQKCDPRHKFEEESIQADDPNALSVEALFQQNISLLHKQRYRGVMTKAREGEWRSCPVPTSTVETEYSSRVVS